MDKILYIAYGSNLNLKQMKRRCPTAKVIGASVIKNYRLLFKGGYESAVATIEPAMGEEVPVLIWELTMEDELALDRYEGWPFLYRKEELRVNLKGEDISAMVYIMNKGRQLNPPGCYYYSVIWEGYKTAGFDIDILRQAGRDSVNNKIAGNYS